MVCVTGDVYFLAFFSIGASSVAQLLLRTENSFYVFMSMDFGRNSFSAFEANAAKIYSLDVCHPLEFGAFAHKWSNKICISYGDRARNNEHAMK